MKVVYGLQNNDAGDAIVAALGDASRKIRLVLAASQNAKNADGSDASAEWKSSVAAKVNSFWQCNEDRVRLAHSLLQPNVDGSVSFVRLRLDRGELKGKAGETWSHEQLAAKIKELQELATKLGSLRDELKTFKYDLRAKSLSAGSPVFTSQTLIINP